MILKWRSLVNHLDIFYSICGKYMKSEHYITVQDFMKRACQACFGMKLGNQDKRFAYKMCKNFT